jgi:hypothetical protein
MNTPPYRPVLLGAAAILFALGTVSAPGTAHPHGGSIVPPARTASASPIGSADGVEALGAPGAAARRHSGAPGYTLFTPRVIGDRPSGLYVRVDPRARNRGAIARVAARAVADQRRQGVNIHWHGYGAPRTASGWINITESNAGCRPGTRVVGITWPSFVRLPNGDLYVDRANIALCPTLFTRYSSAVQNGAIRHEMGHAVGLAHTNYVYRGRYQAMNAVIHPSTRGYQSGDASGLRRLAANAARVRSEVPPNGRLQHSTWRSNGTIALSGWASLHYFRGDAVTITVTDNGRVIRRARTNGHTLRFSATVPWRGGWHTYCVRANSSRSAVAVTNLGCTTWHN